MAIRDGLLAEFDHEMGATRRVLARIPDDRLAWTPHPKSMSLGGLGTHVANLPFWSEGILTVSFFDLETLPPPQREQTTSAGILRLFDETTKGARALMDRTDPEYLAPWTLRRGAQVLFTMPRVAAFRSFVINHMIHHRGQLTVYLRLNDVPLPALYGPTADEG
jgi:uncharacterized damage-inducible protein DinB